VNLDGKDMFTDPRFADHRAPRSRGSAYLSGVVAGMILGVVVGMGALVLTAIIFMRG